MQSLGRVGYLNEKLFSDTIGNWMLVVLTNYCLDDKCSWFLFEPLRGRMIDINPPISVVPVSLSGRARGAGMGDSDAWVDWEWIVCDVSRWILCFGSKSDSSDSIRLMSEVELGLPESESMLSTSLAFGDRECTSAWASTILFLFSITGWQLCDAFFSGIAWPDCEVEVATRCFGVSPVMGDCWLPLVDRRSE